MPDPIKMCRELPVIIDDPGRSYDGFYPRYKYNGLYVDYWSLTPDCAEKVNLYVQTDEIVGDPWYDEDGVEHQSYGSRPITYEELFPEAGTSATLYAHWDRYSVNVHFDANGGEGEMNDMTVTRSGEGDSSLYNSFTREGYSFGSWNTEPDGSGQSFGEWAYVSPTSFDSIPEDGNVTLYAQWE